MEPIFTPEELAQVHAYARPHYIWLAIRDVVSLLVFLGILRFGVRPMYRLADRAAGWINARAERMRRVPVVRALPAALDRLWGGAGWGAALLFSVLYLLLLELIYLPRDIYFTYFLEHAFGMSNDTPGEYAVDELKSLALQIVANSFLAFGMYGLMRRLKAWWLVLGVVAGSALLFSAMLDPWRGQIYFEQHSLPAGPLRERIDRLMAKAHIEYGDVVVEKTSRVSKSVNAYFAGQGPTRTIVLTDTLMENFTPDEIAAVVAHEAGHIHEPRTLRRILSAVGLLAFLFGVDRVLRLAARRQWFGASGFADIRTLPLIGLLLWAVITVGHPFSIADSRARERAADAWALELTRDPDAFRRMLVKATRINKFDPDPPKWVEVLGFNHPTIRERLDFVAAFAEKTRGE
ncbi:MAG: M48 family metalloprotease [Myxococcaceae bacterium]|nr:M48 family metalloprotease [Myxococcaceae bacterium]